MDAELVSVALVVNGRQWALAVEPRRLLADVLREELGLTGTHLGCEQGVCGACTVLLDDQPVRSCLTLAVQADGRAVTTVEGLASGGRLHRVQQAFLEAHGLQCGFCTPGLLITAYWLSRHRPGLSRTAIREELDGHLCRCTGYEGIVEAVWAATREAAQEGGEGA
jgi:carbon-monoxide dehydrogenase small subunit